jgi:hypothetical protein
MSTVPRDSQELSDSQALEFEESNRAERTRLVGGAFMHCVRGAYTRGILPICQDGQKLAASFRDAPMRNCMIMMGCFLGFSPIPFAIWQCFIREDVYSGIGLLAGDGGDCSSGS